MEHIFMDRYILRTMVTTLNTLSLLQKITDNQWIIILKQLIIYAELRLTKIGFKPRTEIDSVSGEDFAMEAIKKLFEGKRAWDSTKHPDLLIHLKLVVKSLIWNHIKSSMKSIVDTQDPLPAANDKNWESRFERGETDDPEKLKEQADHENPLEIVISQERWNQIEAAFGEDADSFIIFCDWLDNVPPKLIAENYNIDVTVVYNIVKKGKRIITKIYAH